MYLPLATIKALSMILVDLGKDFSRLHFGVFWSQLGTIKSDFDENRKNAVLLASRTSLKSLGPLKTSKNPNFRDQNVWKNKKFTTLSIWVSKPLSKALHCCHIFFRLVYMQFPGTREKLQGGSLKVLTNLSDSLRSNCRTIFQKNMKSPFTPPAAVIRNRGDKKSRSTQKPKKNCKKKHGKY